MSTMHVNDIIRDSSDREEAGVSALRALLELPAAGHIDQLEQRIADIETARQDKGVRTEEGAELIADIVSVGSERDNRLGDALRPLVETQFHKAARENVDFMAEALFPVLGPAVRKMVADLISPEKAGKENNIEQIFLIDNPSGLPIAHIAQKGIDTQDADMVASMLSAINSYVHDAFETEKFDALDHLKVGELALWIEWGPQAILAAVVRGTPPEELRPQMQTTLEELHLKCSAYITDYDGSDTGEEEVLALLHPVLDHYDAEAIAHQKKRVRILSLASIGFAALISWIAFSSWDGARWNNYLESVSRLPGVVVLSESRKISGYEVVGLRDPLATDPTTLLQGTGIDPADVRWQWSSIASLHPVIVARRATKILSPEAGVEMSVNNSTLLIVGTPSAEWLTRTQQKALAISGIESISVHNPNSQEE